MGRRETAHAFLPLQEGTCPEGQQGEGAGTDPAGVRPVKGEFCQMRDLGRWLGQLHPVWMGGARLEVSIQVRQRGTPGDKGGSPFVIESS